MKRTDALDYAPGNLFTDGNPAIPIPASVLDASWLNMVQEEIANVIEFAGIILSAGSDQQLWDALNAIIAAKFANAFKVYAGNPNTHVAGTQGNAGTGVFPTVCWDTTNKIWWVCTTTGNAAAAVWEVVGDQPMWPFWCTQSGGTANAPVLTTPAEMTGLLSGHMVAWKITTGPSTANVNVTVGTFGTYALQKDGPAGPVNVGALGELDIGNICTARYDGTVLHLISTELGSAALQDATSNTGKVSAVNGAVTVNKVPKFSDVAGTIVDGYTPSDVTKTIIGMVGAATTINKIPKFSDVNGTVIDGYSPSDTSKTVLASLAAAVTIGRLAKYLDTAGTLTDGPAMSSNTGMLAAVLGAVVAGRIPVWSDTAGTLVDSGYQPSDFFNSADAVFHRLGMAL